MLDVLRKSALQVMLPVLCGLVALNAYLVLKNVKLIQNTTAQRAEAWQMQADISSVLFDLQDMETGQRGYLLTGDPAYLEPYHAANARLTSDFSKLRAKLAAKTPPDRSLETQLESLAQSKIAEMDETIRLREKGYRHRAFLIVNSNRGKELMDEARAKLQTLSSAQTRNIARYDRDVAESVSRAIRESLLASGILLVATALVLLALNWYRRRLEVRSARQSEQLRTTSLRLEQLTSTVFQDFRALVAEMRSYANGLLDTYGDYLPHQAQQQAQRIEDGAGQIIRLLDDLPKNSSPDGRVEPAPLERLSA